MLTDHAAGILSVRSRFTPKTRGVADPLNGEIVQVHDRLGIQIGYRNLCGGDQVVWRLRRRHELVFRELWKLAGTKQCVTVNQIRHIGFFISVLRGMYVQHKLNKRAVHPSQHARHHDESATGNLRRGLKIHHSEPGSQRDMIQHREVKGLRLSPGSDLHISAFVFSRRYRGMRGVGNARQDRVEFTSNGLKCSIQST